MAKFDQFATAIVRLDEAFDVGRVLDQAFVASQFSQEELRRAGLFAQYLATVDLHPPRQMLKDRAENRKLGVLLAGIRGEVFEKSVCEYAAHLKAVDPVLMPRSIRIYVEVAVGLWAAAQCRGGTTVSQGDVDLFLRRNAGYRNSLARYLKFLNASAAAADRLSKPVKTQQVESIRAARESVYLLLDRLGSSKSKRTRAALIAELLAELYGVRLSAILSMKQGDVRDNNGEVELRLGEWLVLSPEIGRWVREVWRPSGDDSNNSAWLFRGRVSAVPLSNTAVIYHLRTVDRHNIPIV